MSTVSEFDVVDAKMDLETKHLILGGQVAEVIVPKEKEGDPPVSDERVQDAVIQDSIVEDAKGPV